MATNHEKELEEIVMKGIILPKTPADEHIVVQRESKARTTLLQSIPDDHKMRKSMLKQEFSEFRISEAEGLHKGYDRMQKILKYTSLSRKLEGRLILIRRNLLGSTRRRSDVTSVFKEATLPENAGQREEMTSKDIPHSRFRRLERRRKIPKARSLLIEHCGLIGQSMMDAIEEGAAKIYNLITRADTKEASTAGDAGEFALMGVTSEVHNCPFGCDNKYNELQSRHNELN
ncbi:hypothetical protein Tco_0855929 [Tanacetum coccineum]